MSRRRGFVAFSPGVSVPQVPFLPGEEPARAPVQPGGQAERHLVAVGRFPDGPVRGVLWDARIEGMPVRTREAGPNQLSISVPVNQASMRLLGDLIPGAFDQSGRQLYHLKAAVAFELLLGSTADGLVRRRFVVRDQVSIDRGRIQITGVGWIGGLTGDRIIGAPTRLNLIRSNASFEQGTLAGWRKVGGAQAGVVPGGPDGRWCAWVTGTPGTAYLERTVTYEQPERPWGRQRVAGQAWVKLPTGLDIDDYGLVTIAVFNNGVQVWPDPDRGDPEAGVVTSSMARGSWLREPVVGVGFLPTPPYRAQVRLRLHPVSTTQRTYYDGGEIFRRENTSTVNPVDLIRHPQRLFDHAQRGRDKSPWGIGVELGAPTGTSEVGTWWHEDGQSMDQALEAVGGRGVEVWDLAGPGRRVRSSRRRGRVLENVRINSWDILGRIGWRIDPGAQVTALRAISGAGSIWGGADEGAVDTRQAFGQVIDVALSAPVGMTPTQLRVWAAWNLSGLSLLPMTATWLLPWDLGMRLEVGDTLLAAPRAGSAAHPDWVRITEWAPEAERRFVAITVGTDPDRGGRR